MPAYRFTDAHEQALRRAEGFFWFGAARAESLVYGEDLVLQAVGGGEHRFSGGYVDWAWRAGAFASATLRVRATQRGAWPDVLHVHGTAYPRVVSERVIEGMTTAGLGVFSACRAEVLAGTSRKPAKAAPRYYACFPGPAGAYGVALGEPESPFSLPHVAEPPAHARGTSDIFSLQAQKGRVTYAIACHRGVLEIAHRDRWTGAVFVAMNLPGQRNSVDSSVDHLAGGWPPVAWRPAMPTESSPDEWIGRAVRHVAEVDSTRLPFEFDLALVHHAQDVVPKALDMLRREIDPARLLAAAHLVRNAASHAAIHWLTTAPPAADVARATELIRSAVQAAHAARA